jgi:hypothetical protein
VTDASQTSQPTTVPDEATRVGAVRAGWTWPAPEVWTERMLTALEQGVRGGRWYTLMDKVCAQPTLRAAFARVKANRGAAGVDHVTVALYEARLEANLTARSQSRRDGTYRPQAIRRHWIPKGPRERQPRGPHRRRQSDARGLVWLFHSHGSFEDLAAWIRVRLRSILRKRTGLRRRGRTADHLRWPFASSWHRGCFPCNAPMLLCVSPDAGDSSTGEPDAGNLPVRFGGRGERNQSFLPTPIGRSRRNRGNPPRLRVSVLILSRDLRHLRRPSRMESHPANAFANT